MRLFLAIEIPDSIRARLVEAQRDLPGKLKLVGPENIHITLQFLGEVPEGRAAAIPEALARPVLSPFDAEMRGLGVFPHPGSPRVLWAGVGRGSGEMVALSREVGQRLAPLGFPGEKRFVPHATLARVKFMAGPDRAALRGVLEARRESSFGGWRVEAVVLKRSTLTPAGPVYDALARFPAKEIS